MTAYTDVGSGHRRAADKAAVVAARVRPRTISDGRDGSSRKEVRLGLFLRRSMIDDTCRAGEHQWTTTEITVSEIANYQLTVLIN